MRGGRAFLAVWDNQAAAQQVISGYDERWSLLAIRGVLPTVLAKVVAALAPVCGYVTDPDLSTEQISVLTLDD